MRAESVKTRRVFLEVRFNFCVRAYGNRTTLDVDENTVKVVLDCTSSTTRVQFSDGFTGTYDSSSIPAHQVTPNTSGSVTVTVTTEDGTFSAVCHYTATGETVEDDREEESKGFQIDNTVLYVAGGIVGILALFVVGRMFL